MTNEITLACQEVFQARAAIRLGLQQKLHLLFYELLGICDPITSAKHLQRMVLLQLGRWSHYTDFPGVCFGMQITGNKRPLDEPIPAQNLLVSQEVPYFSTCSPKCMSQLHLPKPVAPEFPRTWPALCTLFWPIATIPVRQLEKCPDVALFLLLTFALLLLIL